MADVAAALRVTEDDLAAVLALPGKQRYEIEDGRIRARYGHSIAERVEHPTATPPEVLFHGTSAAVVADILREGLRPMARQYVHLSADRATARQVGARRRGPVTVLLVAAGDAHRAGVAFREAGPGVWLADAVPAAYLSVAP